MIVPPEKNGYMNFLGTKVTQPSYITASAWLDHGAFATWLMRRHRPTLLVELGSHYGFSYFAMCEVVASDNLRTSCHAIDTWLGDDHIGMCGNDVYKAVCEENKKYSDFSQLKRKTFREALNDFEDGSIDLLHIDGRHFYEDVKEVFETWQPKLSSSAIVLFHDTQVLESDFGVSRFWAEISDEHPSINFLHGNGLGVLGWGEESAQIVEDLVSSAGKNWSIGTPQNFFEAAGKITRERMHRKFMEENSSLNKEKLRILEIDLASAQSKLAASQIQLSRLNNAERDVANSANPNALLDVADTAELAQGTTESQAILPSPMRSYLKTLLLRTAAKLPLFSKRKRNKFIGLAKKEAAQKKLPSIAVANRRLRAVFISGEPVEKPGFRYRIRNYANAFRALGVSSKEVHISEVTKIKQEIETADFVFVWRARWNSDYENLIEIAKKGKGILIYDLDDLMVRADLVDPIYIDSIRFNHLRVDQVKAHYRSISEAMSSSDFTTSTTQELDWELLRHDPTKASMVLPNGYDEVTYSLTRASVRASRQENDGLVRIGYASGSRTHQRDFEICCEAVAEVIRSNDNVRLVLFRLDELVTLDVVEYECFRGLESKIEWREMVPHAELPKEIARFDINLAPLEVGNPFCEAKSELKFFEAAIADVPTIASPTGPFKACITHGVSGFLASSSQDWQQMLQDLVDDAALRCTVGENAHLAALWPFGTKRRVELASTMLDALKGGRALAKCCIAPSVVSKAVQFTEHSFSECREVYSSGNFQPSRVSIVVTVYNYEDKILEALNSVHQQEMQAIELIVVDDASTDNSCQLVHDWMRHHGLRFNRCVLLSNAQNSGLGTSRNNGFLITDCSHVMSLDADNKLRPNCCQRLVEEAERTGAAFAYPIIERFGDMHGFIGNRHYSPMLLKGGNFIDAMALVSKEAWAFVGGYATHRMGWQDYDLWCRFVDKGLFGVHVPEVLADYRVHSSSMLRVSTDKIGNKIKLLDWMEEQHDWLCLTSQERDAYRTSYPQKNGGTND